LVFQFVEVDQRFEDTCVVVYVCSTVDVVAGNVFVGQVCWRVCFCYVIFAEAKLDAIAGYHI
jgi:hypothetical protein